ncbi:MAG: hypothetical protein ACLPX7_06460 [Xanthobacteraceae bacterium]
MDRLGALQADQIDCYRDAEARQDTYGSPIHKLLTVFFIPVFYVIVRYMIESCIVGRA